MANITTNLTDIIDPKTIASYIWSAMPSNIFNGLSFILTLAKTAGILFIIYLCFLIIQSVVRIRQALKVKSIEKTVDEMNKKLDLLLEKKKKD